MKLYEFFTQQSFANNDIPKEEPYKTDSQESNQRLEDDLYWHILDDNYLHKKFFLPIAREIKIKMNNNTYDKSDYIDCWMPMVKSGCLDFYKVKEMKGDIKDIFSKKMRNSICKRLATQFQEDIKNNSYNLGV